MSFSSGRTAFRALTSGLRAVEALATTQVRARARRNADAALDAIVAAAASPAGQPEAAAPASGCRPWTGPATTRPAGAPGRRSFHRLLPYPTLEHFLDVAAAFLAEGHTLGDRMLVITAPDTAAALRVRLPEGASVHFVEARTWYRSPAHAMAACQDYLSQREGHAGLRIIGEPALAGRPEAELAEWACYESALNVAFPGLQVRAICAYSAAELPAAVLAEARRTHPEVADGARARPSAGYVDPFAFVPADEPELPAAPLRAADTALDGRDLDAVQRFVTRQCFEVSMFGQHARTFGLAAREAARDLVPPGAPGGRLRVWRERHDVVCELTCPGLPPPRIAACLPPRQGSAEGRGLWLAGQLCRHVQLRPRAGATVARLHYAAPPG